MMTHSVFDCSEMALASLLQRVTRKRCLESLSEETVLSRCLSTCDLMLLGIGGMVGSGIYVLTGVAAKEHAGEAMHLLYAYHLLFLFKANLKFTRKALKPSL